MPIIPNLSVLDSFESVYNSLNDYHGPWSNHTSIALKYLTVFYELSPASVEVIAYLLHFRPNKVATSKLRILCQNRNEFIKNVTKDLTTRKFITANTSSDGTMDRFSIHEKAYEAFQKGVKYGMPVFEDCVLELSRCPYSSIFTDKWLQCFYSSLDLPKNSQLKSACETLGIRSLPESLQMAFWALAGCFTRRFSSTIKWDENLLPSSVDVEAEMGNLAQYGLATVIPIEEDSQTRSEFILSTEAARALFQGRDELIRYDDIARFATVIKLKDIKKKDLYFSDQAQEEIDHLRTMLSPEGFKRAIQILRRKKRAPSIQSLLWGPPGTGKTESVKQLALESGRDIILFDISKVTGYGWGTTEKCYRSLFRAYNNIAAISNTTPILLLNEADAILSRRLNNIEKAIDKSENSITNILLEELENLNGILLATTNLIDNLDDAFDRRFLFKTELTKPDEAARARIWKSSIPELTEDEAAILAGKYEMSGAQINNVVTKRDLAELYYTGDRGLLYIERLCATELSTENGTKGRRPRIGF